MKLEEGVFPSPFFAVEMPDGKRRTPRRKAGVIVAAALAAAFLAVPLARSAEFSESFIAATNSDWNTAANWSAPGNVPINGVDTYDVTVNNIGTVYYDVTGSNSISTLDLTGTGLTLNSGDNLTVLGVTILTNAAVTANSASFIASDTTNMDGASLTASGSGIITVGNVTSFATFDSNTNENLTANGSTAQVNLASLTSINLQSTANLYVQAQNGGAVDLSNLATITHTGTRALVFQTTGTGSTLNITALGNAGMDGITMDVETGGAVQWGTPTTLTNSELDVTGLVTLDTSHLSDIDGSNINIYTAGNVSMPNLTSYATVNVNANNNLQASGAGAVLTLANLTTINLQSTASLYVQANNGGTVDLSGLTTLNRPGSRALVFQVEGAGSTLKIPTLGPLGLDNIYLTVQTGGDVQWGITTQLTNSELDVTGAVTLDTSHLSDIDGSNINIYAAGNVSMPNLTSYSTVNVNANNNLQANGAGAQLTLANLTTIKLQSTASLYVQAYNGGTVDLSGLTTLNHIGSRAIVFQVAGTGSTLKIPALGPLLDSIYLTVQNGGAVQWGTPTALTNSELDVTGSVTLDTSHLNDLNASNVYVYTGGIISMPNLLTYSTANANVDNTLQANGAGAELTLANLTTLNLQSTAGFYVQAYNGGTIDLSGLATINHNGTRGIVFQVTGTDSTLKIPGLGTAGIGNVTLDVETGGTVQWGAATHFTNSNLTVAGAATINTSGLTDINGSNVTVSTGGSPSAGGSVTLPALTGYTAANANVDQTLGSTGAGSSLSLPALTTLHLPGSAGVFIQALNGATTSLPALTTFDADGGTRMVSFQSHNANSMIVLTALKSMSSDAEMLDIEDHGSVEMGAFSDPFTLHFRADFLNVDGDLVVSYNGTQIADIAPNNLNAWETYDYSLTDPGLPFGPDPEITFNIAGTNAAAYVDEYQATEIPNVPEPASLALLGLGAAGVLASRKRRPKATA